jgi:hypothetical protein
MTTNVDITNRALAQIGTHSQITSMTDGSEEARYANLLYNPLRDFLLTEGDYDFSIGVAVLTPNGTGGGSTRFILTKEAVATAIYTAAPLEDVWGPIFTEAFTRLLASALAFAIENRIEASKEKLSEALNFAGIANLRDP